MSIPFALSLSKYVNSAGTDVGFASLLAVALLAILYFAGARETRTLRDQLDDAHDRISSLEARVAQALRQNAGRGAGPAQTGQVPSVPGRPGVVAPPSVTTAPTSSSVSRVPRAPAPVTPLAVASLLGATAGAGAPSLGSATKLIPSPVAVPVPSAVPSSVPATALGVSSAAYPELDDDDEDEYTDDFATDDTMFEPATAGASANGRGGGGPALSAPPRVQFRDDAPEGPPPRRTVPTVASGPSRPRRLAGRLVGLVGALLVVAGIVVALLLVTASPKSHKARTAVIPLHTATHAGTRSKTTAFKPATVKVSVLNGTAVGHLATDVGKMLAGAGYTVPTAIVTNAALQTATTTTVGYLPGFKADGVRVARALSKAAGVMVTTVAPADQASITSCETPVNGSGATSTCPAKVIVTVGTDLAGAATTAGSSG